MVNHFRIKIIAITPTQIEHFKYSIQQSKIGKKILVIDNPNTNIENPLLQYPDLIRGAKGIKPISLVHVDKYKETELETQSSRSNEESVANFFSGKHFKGFSFEDEHTVKGLLNNEEKLYNCTAHLLTASGKVLTKSDARYLSSIQNPICIELMDSEDILNITEQVEMINPDNSPSKIIFSIPSIIQGPIEFMTRHIEDMESLFLKLRNKEISWLLNPFTDLPDQFLGNDYKKLNENIIKDTINKAKKALIHLGGFFVKVLPDEGDNICLLHEEDKIGRKKSELFGLDIKYAGRRNIGMNEEQTAKIISEIGKLI